MYGTELSRPASRVRATARILVSAALLALVAIGSLSGCRSAHTTSAILYIDDQNYDKAVKVLHEGFEFTQDEPDAYYYLGEAHSHLAEEAVAKDDYAEALKNYDLAYKSYRRAVELNPEDWTEQVNTSLAYNYRTRLIQANGDWDQERFEQAEGHLRLAYAALPDSLTPIKNIARMKIQMAESGEFEEQKTALRDEALELLDQVLATRPDAYSLQLDKAYVLATLGRTEEAGRIYDDLLATRGDDTVLLRQVANLALEQQEYARAADFYVKVVDLFEKDTDPANDGDNVPMLVSAGTWYARTDIARFDEAIAVLDRAGNLEMFPTEGTMLARLRTYYNYGRHLKEQAAAEADPLLKQEASDKSSGMFRRAIEIGGAMTNQFVANAQGFLYLSLAQLEMGDFTASETNTKTYEQLMSGSSPQP
ncbi:MAG: tetratricopeptide repeat protein [bacterium]|nr:tetratricopeptide repeat protein [bacterium]